ncbi:MAG: hypothetical protein MJ244_05115 [Clostridia bacterium]|nr:hypothetical protein [Clostridia bacterium]
MTKEIRQYFKSAEEMHKAFIDGKKVHWKGYDKDITPKYYQMKDGIICSFDVFNDKMLGIAHGSFCDFANYFTFEKPVIKMQVGKKYKNRRNQIVFCFYNYIQSRKAKYNVVILDKSINSYYTVNADGNYWNGGNMESECDIVEEVND